MSKPVFLQARWHMGAALLSLALVAGCGGGGGVSSTLGTGSGFGTALLSLKAREVTTYERDAAIFAFASENLHRAGIVNVALHDTDGSQVGGTEQFDIIVLSGSVREVPQALLDRLTVGGRLFAFVGGEPTMQARLHTRGEQGRIDTENLFETMTPRLHGFPDREPFRF